MAGLTTRNQPIAPALAGETRLRRSRHRPTARRVRHDYANAFVGLAIIESLAIAASSFDDSAVR
jgi:hypothetical protein